MNLDEVFNTDYNFKILEEEIAERMFYFELYWPCQIIQLGSSEKT
jgi:hypothetical protein